MLDVGTGGGVPGIVLAILREDCISLSESVGKKARTGGRYRGETGPFHGLVVEFQGGRPSG